uniref:Uncharacterized protein n=1 Tax=Ditylenchus dipsaci TaxID=166011 RepID=A0A915EA52_9BILA
MFNSSSSGRRTAAAGLATEGRRGRSRKGKKKQEEDKKQKKKKKKKGKAASHREQGIYSGSTHTRRASVCWGNVAIPPLPSGLSPATHDRKGTGVWVT